MSYGVPLYLAACAVVYRSILAVRFMRETLRTVSMVSAFEEAYGRRGGWRYHEYRKVPVWYVLCTPWLSLHPSSYWEDTAFLAPLVHADLYRDFLSTVYEAD